VQLFSTPRTPILTPCIGICRLGADGLCEGCHRSAEEIAAWMSLSDAQRLHLMDEVLPRRAESKA
jgi:predicted Fe-S protein YdhL (DUF1289 family)